MLNLLRKEANKTFTENGAVTNRSTMSECLDLFATAGALRNASENEIATRFMRAFAEDRDTAMRILFFARDIRGGLGERRFFRVALKALAQEEPDTVRKNIGNIAEYGRCDDILVLMGTPCECEATAYINETLRADLKAMGQGLEVSLMAKWLPSVNASNAVTVKTAKRLARALNMSDEQYRKTLSSLRSYIRIIENNLRERDYSFDYECQPSKALFKYRQAFIRNDEARYSAFIRKAILRPAMLNTSTLTPYDIVGSVLASRLRRKVMSPKERKALDATWNALENYVNSSNTLAVVDGSGSMYCGPKAMPAAVAQSLGIYFAERNNGAFHDHFITFSATPRLVKIKGRDIYEKVKYCMSFNECSNTNIEKTFDLILNTAVKYELSQSEMPGRLIIISDMEFDWCAENAEMTNFENAKAKFNRAGYKLPSLVFWNVNSRRAQQPVTMNEQGVVLVSGMSPQIFGMFKNDKLDPYEFMMSVISSKRYARIAA
ncbi:MAG: DUF2828 family protein [Clostridiales bacterium]|nr:DUF2828 family protein [Clostridiales bacterium]